MKPLQKVKVTVENGKVTKEENIGKQRAVADSIAEDLLIQSEELLNKDNLSKLKGVKILTVWKEGKSLKQTKKTEEKA